MDGALPARIRVVEESAIDAALDEAIRGPMCESFYWEVETFSKTRAWHGSKPEYTVLAEEDGRVVGHVGVVVRDIEVGGTRIRIAGVQNVFVTPDRRGRGLVDAVMAESMREARGRRIDAGLLMCFPALEKVYARCGWKTLDAREVWAIRESGERYALDDKNILMFYPLGRGTFPGGAIELMGDDW